MAALSTARGPRRVDAVCADRRSAAAQNGRRSHEDLGVPPLLYATFLGGSDNDEGYGIAVDGAGQAYVTGITGSADFPASLGPGYDTSFNGGGDAFVVKLDAAGTALRYATFLGGSSSDDGARHRRGRRGQRLRDGLYLAPATSRPRRAPSTPSYNGGDLRRLRGQAEPGRQRAGLRHLPGRQQL